MQQVYAVLCGQPPNARGIDDFEVLVSGWQRGGRGASVFQGLVQERWRKWEDGVSRLAQQREGEERQMLERQRELTKWLEQLGLGEFGPLLLKEGIDLDTLQYLCAQLAAFHPCIFRSGPPWSIRFHTPSQHTP